MTRRDLLFTFAVTFFSAFFAVSIYMTYFSKPSMPAPAPTPQMYGPMMPGQMGPQGPMMPGQMPPSGMQHPMPGQPPMMQGRPPMPPNAGKPSHGAKPMPMPAPAKAKK